MLKQHSEKVKFNIYTPFVLKTQLIDKKSPNKLKGQENGHRRNRSPYTVKNYVSLKNRKETRIQEAPLKIEEEKETTFVRTGRLRIMSAPHKQHRDFVFSSGNSDRLRSNEREFDGKSNSLTNYSSLKLLKNENMSSFIFPSPYAIRSKRKFNFEMVKVDKQKIKGQLLADKKIQKYNYKTVIGQAVPFRTKKVRQILIEQNGKVTYQKN